MQGWVSKREACLLLGMSHTTLQKEMADKKITYYRFGDKKNSKVRFMMEDIKKYLNERKG